MRNPNHPKRAPTDARTPALTLTLLLLLLAPVAHAQQDDPLIEDPVGDAGTQGVAMPVAWDLFDLVAVRFAAETEQTVEIHIETASPGTQPPVGEIAVHFEADGAWWLMGWSTVTFPAPPFVYQGGFYCPSDAAQGFDAGACSSLPATFADHALVLTVGREAFGLHRAGTTVTTPSAYSAIYDADGDPLPIDGTDVGGAYTFRTGRAPAAEATNDEAPADETSSGASPTVRATTPPEAPTPRADAEAPGTALVVVLGLGLAALLVARRTRPNRAPRETVTHHRQG